MEEKRYLVTGGAGFAGAQLIRELRDNHIPVRALVRKPEQVEALQASGIEALACDIRDRDGLQKAMEGIYGVYHIAALFRQANQPDSAYREINAAGVRNVIDAAIAAGVKRLVHCSTVGVLGDVKEIPATENTEFNPGDIYQVTKLEGEKIALDAFREEHISGVVIRPAMIYGPGDTRMLKMFRMIAKRRFFYLGRGRNLVHFVDVRDLARAFRLAMDHTERNGEVYIISGERAMTLKELAEITAKELGVTPPWIRLPVKPVQWLGSLCEAVCIPFGINPPLYRRRVDFYTKNRSFSSQKAREHLGFQPSRTAETEVRDIVADYRQRGWL